MTKLVFLVDDSPTVRKIIQTILMRNGIECYAVPDAEKALQQLREALAAAKQIPWPVQFPQLLLVDLNLPGMSGREFIEKVKAIPQITSKIAICTGEQSFLTVSMDGISACITKPIEEKLFIETIKSLLKEGT